MKIPEQKLEILRDAHAFCDEQDKSTEFMIEYMCDVSQLDFDTVMYYLKNSKKLRFLKDN